MTLDPDPLVPLDYDRVWADGYSAGWQDAPEVRRPGERFRPLRLVIVLATGIVIGILLAPAVRAAAPRSAPEPVVPASIQESTGARRPAAARYATEEARPSAPPMPVAAVSGQQPPSARARAASMAGIASWYRDPTPPRTTLYAAVPGWHFGDRPYVVRVSAGRRSVLVLVQDCLCGRIDRLIDLSATAFARLAPLSRGVLRVTVQRLREPRPPATDR
jgi:rare lipoprotein A (peptidoglycan hydrolase)